MIAHINIEDVDGAIAYSCNYPGGFDVQSHAHQITHLVTQYLESILKQQGEPIITTTKPGEVFGEHDAVCGNA